MGQLSGWQQGKGPEGLRTGRWWGAKWESRGGAHRGGGRRDLGGGRGQLPAEGPASTGPGQGRVRGRKEACVCSEACVRERRPERQAGATPAGRWSSDAERGSVVRGGPSVRVRVSVHEGRVWRDSRTWYSGCWARVDGSCHRYLPCHGKPPRSHPPLVSGLVFGSGLSGSASGTLQVLNSQSCAELCPQRWSGRGQLTTWPAMQRAQWLLVEVWPWSGMTSTPAIWSSGAPLFLHTHWAAPCVHPLRPRLEPGHSQQQPLRCHAWPRKVTRPGQTQAHR